MRWVSRCGDLVELLTAVLSAAVDWRYGFGWQAGAALLVTWCLIALSGIDLDTTFLPDIITIPLLWLGLLVSLAAVDASSVLALPVSARSAIIGATVGYMSLWTLYHLFKLLTGKEGMGYGDFKLFAALGASSPPLPAPWSASPSSLRAALAATPKSPSAPTSRRRAGSH